MEGTLKDRNGKLYVLYTYDEYSEPFRQFIWWRVLETRGTGYGERPEAGDIATSTGGGEWRTHNPSTHRSTGSVSTGTRSTQAETVERISINPPSAGGKELRWRDGRWEKLMAKGWMPAGEGKAKTSKKSPSVHSAVKRHHATKKSPAQLDREIAAVLSGTTRTAIDTTETIDRKFQSRQRDSLTLSEKARQARGAAARWLKRSSTYAQAGEFRAANDAETEAIALRRMANQLEADVAHIRSIARR